MSVPVKEGGDDRECSPPSGVCPGEEGGSGPKGQLSP